MWIEDKLNSKRVTVFYREFNVNKEIKKCFLKISALGIFNVKINGEEIKDYFMPGWTNYNKYVHLVAYDITKNILEENLLEVTLADGWYTGRLGYYGKGNIYGDKNALFVQIVIEYLDGQTDIIDSNEQFKVGNSNIVSSSLFDGEKVDFNIKKEEINNLPCALVRDISIPFKEYSYEAVREIERITPTYLINKDDYIKLDFNQNFAGVISFYVEGKKGTKVVVKYGEILSNDGSVYYENLRSAKCTDEAILSENREFFQPKFTYHGFRYAEIFIDGEATISDIKGIVLSEDLRYYGSFNCSDDIINKIYENAKWGQKSNFISIPTDCPQRDERLGWSGDAQVFSNSAMFNSSCGLFYRNYLELMRIDAFEDGRIPSFVPFFVKSLDYIAGVPGWGDAIVIIPYYHYLHYKDKRVIEENIEYAERHVNYYINNSEEYIVHVNNPYGDWLSVKRHNDIDGINQCMFGLTTLFLSRMFCVLGDKKRENKYYDIYLKVKEAFRKKFLREDGFIVGDSQTIYALSLETGFVEIETIKEFFINSVKREGDKLTTGFIGVKYLLPALCDIGEVDLAYRIIKGREYPSWGYTITQGATTIWERWNGYTEEKGFEDKGMNSFNHFSLGSCVEWMYSYVLGIKLNIDNRICISPAFSQEISYAKGGTEVNGEMVFVEWYRKDGDYYLTIKSKAMDLIEYDFTGREIISIDKEKDKIEIVIR